MKLNHRLVLIEFKNCSPFVYKVVSDKPITIKRLVEYFGQTEDFNENRDSLIFLDDLSVIDLDKR